MKKILLLLISFTLLAFAAPATNPLEPVPAGGCSGTFGNDNNTAATPAPEAYRAYLAPVTLTCSDTAGDVCAYLDEYNTTDQRVILVIYDDDGPSGEPASLIDDVMVTTSGTLLIEVCEAFTGSVSGSLWVGVILESTSNYYGYYATSGSDGRYKTLSSFEAPSTWDYGGDSTSTYDRNFYLKF